jgi:hypothetical protein
VWNSQNEKRTEIEPKRQKQPYEPSFANQSKSTYFAGRGLPCYQFLNIADSEIPL